MNQSDRDVLQQGLDLLKQGTDLWLCTILATYGSAPRPVGSVFITDGHRRFGSISGGCVEDAFVQLIADGKLQKNCEIFDYGTHIAPHGTQFELPCGGHIQILVEHLTPQDQAILLDWLAQIETEQPFGRAVNLTTGERKFFTDEKEMHRAVGFNANAQQATPQWGAVFYAKAEQLLLLGISQVSEILARLAKQAGFVVRLCDNRPEYAANWQWTPTQGGIDVEWASPDYFVEKYVTPRTAVLALAHAPRVDDLAMMAALESDAFYIGALGSHRNSEKRRERLARIGEYSLEMLDRLRAPIGLPIGSKTPFEIAIAILADVIATKNHIKLEQCKR